MTFIYHVETDKEYAIIFDAEVVADVHHYARLSGGSVIEEEESDGLRAQVFDYWREDGQIIGPALDAEIVKQWDCIKEKAIENYIENNK